jgi:hypothetical protein
MPPTDAAPGTTADNPLYFKFLRADDDSIDWGKVVLALALTVLSGYLATQAQRAGSNPDQLKAAKMRFHKTVKDAAEAQVTFWRKVADNAGTRYDIARL